MVNINQPRKLDTAGRLSIPKGIRDKYGWDEGTEFEIFESEAYETDSLMIIPTERLNENPVDERLRAVLRAYDIDNEMLVRDILDEIDK